MEPFSGPLLWRWHSCSRLHPVPVPLEAVSSLSEARLYAASGAQEGRMGKAKYAFPEYWLALGRSLLFKGIMKALKMAVS